MIKVIVLDFDGVVVESLDIKTDAFSELFTDYPRFLDAITEYNLTHRSISRFTKFEHVVTRILGEPYNETRKKELGDRFSQLTRQKIISCPYVTGAKEFISYFSSRVPLYVASATPQEDLEYITGARDISRFFKGIYGKPPWEKVDVIRKVIGEEKVKSGEIAYIGDSKEDLAVAQAAGMYFIGRVNRESFDGLEVPVYPDMAGVKKHLEKMIV